MKWLIVLMLTLLVCSYIAWLAYCEWQQYREKSTQHGVADKDWQRRCEKVSSELVEQSHWQGFRDFVVAKRVIENTVGDIVSFYLQPRDGMPLSPFLAGQYVTVRLPVGSQVYTRCYSLSEQFHPDYYRISVKHLAAPDCSNLPAGQVSSFLHEQVYEGAVIELREPQGSFVLPSMTTEPLVFLVAGVGYTPILSMLKVLVNRPFSPPVVVFYCVRNGEHQAARQEFEAMKAKYRGLQLYICFSHPRPQVDRQGVDYHIGSRLDAKSCLNKLEKYPLNPQQCHYYFCGPETFMTKLQHDFTVHGINPDHFHDECFSPSNTHLPQLIDAPDTAEVIFSSSGRQSEWLQEEDRWLLNLSEEEGININSACRKGSCGSCMTEVLEGEVGYISEPEFLKAQPENRHQHRYCLPCVCYPKSNRVVLNA